MYRFDEAMTLVHYLSAVDSVLKWDENIGLWKILGVKDVGEYPLQFAELLVVTLHALACGAQLELEVAEALSIGLGARAVCRRVCMCERSYRFVRKPVYVSASRT